MKALLSLIISIVFLFFVSACGGGGSSGSAPSGEITAPVDTPPDDNLALDDFEDAVPHDTSFTSAHFSGSQNCAQCHDGITDTGNGKDVSLVKAWSGTMMGNAAIDPLYLAKVASEVKRNPDFKEVIEAKCSRCHMPMAHVEAGFADDAVVMFGDGFLNPENPHYNAAKDSVSCTLCHQIKDTPQLGTVEGYSGKFVIAENFGTDRKSYGQYTNPKTGPMINSVAFTPTYSAHMDKSKLCATCHNLNTPVIDAQGSLNGDTFPEQAVYTEWEYSDFNRTKSCQDCHMPQTEGSVVISSRGNVGPRSPFHQHQFIGANTYMLEILKNNRIKLGAAADTAIFEESISNTRDFLKAAADVTIGSIITANGTLNFSVLVRNHSGHKFPTSLPSRRAWLHVKVTKTSDQTVVFESGALNSEGQIIGVDDNAEGYEEHYKKIDESSEVQVYEPIMADTDGKMTYTFMKAARYLKDNRILPLGFKSNAPDDVKPYGEAADDSDFVGGSDTVVYEVDNIPSGDYTIFVTLHYQTASYGFMQDLYRDAALTEVALMKVLNRNTQNHYETISTDSASVTIP